MECKIKIDEGQFLALKDHKSIIGILSQNPIQIKKSATADRVIKLCFVDGAKPKTNPILGKSICDYFVFMFPFPFLFNFCIFLLVLPLKLIELYKSMFF